MCFSSPDIPDMPPPPPPPPPAPNQSAKTIETSGVTSSQRVRRATRGLAKYRTDKKVGGNVDAGVRPPSSGSSSMSIY